MRRVLTKRIDFDVTIEFEDLINSGKKVPNLLKKDVNKIKKDIRNFIISNLHSKYNLRNVEVDSNYQEFFKL